MVLLCPFSLSHQLITSPSYVPPSRLPPLTPQVSLLSPQPPQTTSGGSRISQPLGGEVCREPCCVLKIKEAGPDLLTGAPRRGYQPKEGLTCCLCQSLMIFWWRKLRKRVFSVLRPFGNHNTAGIYES